jgi:hypothetical protein
MLPFLVPDLVLPAVETHNSAARTFADLSEVAAYMSARFIDR